MNFKPALLTLMGLITLWVACIGTTRIWFHWRASKFIAPIIDEARETLAHPNLEVFYTQNRLQRAMHLYRTIDWLKRNLR